jgi:IclR family transcriptional regulator, acetate operon repressor
VAPTGRAPNPQPAASGTPNPAQPAEPAASGTPSLTGADRVLATLKTLAGHSSGVSLDALSRELGAPKSSVHRALAALRRAGFADQDERARYRLGSELVRIAFDYHERRDEVDLVRPVLGTLSDWLSETAHYAQLDGAEVVYLAKIEPTGQAITMSSRIGGRNPAHSTGVGKALLAHVLEDDEAVRDFVARYGPLQRRTKNTLVSARALADDLRSARERGYALDREESELGVNCIAFPLFLGSGRRPSGSVSVSAVAMRTDVDRLEAVAERIRAAIEEALGPVTRPAARRP